MDNKEPSVVADNTQPTITKRILEDKINWLEIENQYLKQKINQLEEKENETRN